MTLDSCLLWLRLLRMARWRASLATAWRSSGKTRVSRPVFPDRGSTSSMTPLNSNNIVMFSNHHIFSSVSSKTSTGWRRPTTSRTKQMFFELEWRPQVSSSSTSLTKTWASSKSLALCPGYSSIELGCTMLEDSAQKEKNGSTVSKESRQSFSAWRSQPTTSS